MSTIFALASGRGRAGVAVIRISGERAHQIVEALCGSVPPLRKVVVRKLRWEGEILDEALVLAFGQGASFTGEDSAELHVHGGQAVLEAVFKALLCFEGVRLAEAGEFTRRALENGKLELFEVEGLVDLIDAETEAQRKQAQRMLQGDLRRKVLEWREVLLGATALVEVSIDFSDEDIPDDIWPEVRARLITLLDSLRTELSGSRMAERVRAGFEVAVYGPPNVGKSSLINALVGRDVAITSEIAGTTRDIIETRLDLGGLPVVILDTAGLRDSTDAIEQEGIRRARERTKQADLRIVMIDQEHSNWDAGLRPDFVVSSKADLGWRAQDALAVSAKTGAGLEELRDALTERLAQMASIAGVVVNERHRAGVAGAVEAVERVLRDLDRDVAPELIAAQLREARNFLEALIGRIGVEDVLGEIFGRFCIGK
ncbi:MAG: tRNA uridine-5-carboxymethylaminomethyl(34) synthesis GTPase MnmE [Pseudomonadota bacterium]|jgi:tRNA modification GTPase